MAKTSCSGRLTQPNAGKRKKKLNPRHRGATHQNSGNPNPEKTKWGFAKKKKTTKSKISKKLTGHDGEKTRT